MKNQNHNEATALRALIDSLGEQTTGRRYDAQLRARLAAYVRAELARGASLLSISKALRVPCETLKRFMSETAKPMFAPVSVCEAVPNPNRTLTVHGPCGVRIDGLTFDELAKLIRSLSCSV